MKTLPQPARTVESPTRIVVNFTKLDGRSGAIPVESGTCCAAVAKARALGGTSLVIREFNAAGECVDRVRVLA